MTQQILQEHLAACVNIVSGINSFYHWQGRIDQAAEVMMIIKTKTDRLKELTNFVQMHHSYDVPEIIALPVIGGSDEYLSWINAETEER